MPLLLAPLLLPLHGCERRPCLLRGTYRRCHTWHLHAPSHAATPMSRPPQPPSRPCITKQHAIATKQRAGRAHATNKAPARAQATTHPSPTQIDARALSQCQQIRTSHL